MISQKINEFAKVFTVEFTLNLFHCEVHHHARGGGIDVFKEQQLSLYCEISDYNDMNESYIFPH